MTVEAYVERVEARAWRAIISLSKEDGTAVGHREFWSEEPTCAAVAESASLAIALMIDPDALLRPQTRLEIIPSAPVASPPPGTWRGAVETATGIGAGLLPGFSPGVFVRARAVEPSRTLGIEIDSAYYFEQRAELRQNAGASFGLFYAGVSLCGLPWGTPRISALMCAGANVGSMTATGYGFFDTQPKSQHIVVNVAGRGRVAFRVEGPWTILVGGDVLVPFQRDRFEVRLAGVVRELFRPSAVAGVFELGLAYEF
jgi:hypothetical protein